MKLLLDKGAAVDETALKAASSRGHEEIVGLLVGKLIAKLILPLTSARTPSYQIYFEINKL